MRSILFFAWSAIVMPMNGNDTSLTIVAERKSIYAAFVTGFSALAFSLIYFADQTLPLFGRYSIGLTAAILAALITFVMFLVSWRAPKHSGAVKRTHRIIHAASHWTKRSAVAFVHAALVFLVLSALFFLLQQAFKGLELNALAASAIVALSVAGVSYMLYPLVYALTLENLAVILAAFLGAGVLTSAMTMQDPTWWQYHFSSLGAGNPVAAFTFNITLIVAGIVVITITQLVIEGLQKSLGERKRGVATAGHLLVGTGAALACVGLFNFEDHLTIHNIAASGMGVLFIILTASLPKLIPFFDKSFYTASYTMLAGLLLGLALFITGYFNLTAFELLCAGIIFCWFVVFIRQIATIEANQNIDAFI